LARVHAPARAHALRVRTREKPPLQRGQLWTPKGGQKRPPLDTASEAKQSQVFLLAFFEIASVAFGSLAMTVKTFCTPVLNFLRRDQISRNRC
ncbi:MAG: hypothetical protein AB1742_13860, partial [bacterium]